MKKVKLFVFFLMFKGIVMKHTLILLAALLLAPQASLHAADAENLRCEYVENPLGIDTLRPRLSWKLETANVKS